MNIATQIAYRASLQPNAVALIHGPLMLRFAEFDAVVRAAAARLAALGLAPGDRVGITLGITPLHIVALLGLAHLGAVSVPLRAHVPLAARREIVRRYGVKAIVGEDLSASVEGARLIATDADWCAPGGAAGDDVPAAPGGEQPWRITLTSGTTGTPKALLYSHARFLTQLLLRRAVIEVGPGSRFLCVIGFNGNVGLAPALQALLFGGALLFPRTPRPEHILETCERLGATHSFMSPAVAGNLLRRLRGDRPRAPNLAHLLVAGSAMSRALREAIVARMTPGLEVSYGASEMGLVSVGGSELEHELPNCVGRVVPWVEVQIVDESGRALPPDETGIVRARGIGFPQSYYENPEATAKAFRDGWFYPGDLGRITRDGLLCIESRMDDMINLGGVKVIPAEVEAVLEQHPAVVEASVFAVNTRSGGPKLCAALVLRHPVQDQELLAYARERLGPRAPRRIVRRHELPRTVEGKVLRAALASPDPEGGAEV